MMAYPQFLNEEELTDYKKDTCLFCNERFRTRSKSSSHEEWSSGCYSDHKYDVTTTTNYVADLDLYYFSFQFQSEDETKLRVRQKQLQQDITARIESEVPLVEQELREKLIDLPERWKDKKEEIVQAVVQQHLSEIQSKYGVGMYRENSPLEKRLEKVFHNLEFGDLQLVEKGYDHSPRGSRTAYCPRGLKSHHRCWPYAPVEEPTDLVMPFGQLVEPVLKNKRFTDYKKLFTETPEIWKDVQQMPIMLNAQQYNPVDWMVR